MTTIDWTAPPPTGYRRDARGNLIADANVSDLDLAIDRCIDIIMQFGRSISGELYRFREHCIEDLFALADDASAKYGGKIGGRKGNIQITSFDGRRKVALAQSRYVAPSLEIHAAEEIVGECIEEWSKGANRNLQALVRQAFEARGDGTLSVSRLLALRRIRIDDPRWESVRAAIADGLKPIGRAEYIRLYERATPTDPWQPVPLTIASAVARAGADDGDPRERFVSRVRRAAGDLRAAGLSQEEIRSAAAEAIRVRAPRTPAS